jgi:hypothetical protein
LRFAAMEIVAQSLSQPICFFPLGLFCSSFIGFLITTQY